MKDYLKKVIANKRNEFAELQKRSDASEDLKEVRALGETLAKLRDEIAEAEQQLASIDEPAEDGENNEGEGRKIVMGAMEIRKNETVNRAESAEYRSAYLKNLMGKTLTAEEQRSMDSGDVVIPVQTSNAVITKIKEICPLLDEITLLHVAGNVSFAVEGTVNDAALHAENGSITAAADTLTTISLTGYEIVKLVRISATVKTMTIDAFENWLTDMLARKVAEKIEDYIINGTGSSQPKGIDAAATWADGTNAVKWAAAAPTLAELTKQISLLPSRHARGAKFLMNRNTFWTALMPLRDDKKMPIVSGEGAGAYNIFGYPVELSDYVAAGDVFFGNLKMVVANLADDIKVDSSAASGFAYNAIDYRGAAIFDCDIAENMAFIKGAATL